MKLLDLAGFDNLNSLLFHNETRDLRLFGRVEAYSCRWAGTDKKLFSSLDHHLSDSQNSPGKSSFSPENSPFGPLSNRQCRKTLIFLISTMNQSFPDYDFSNVRADDFRKEPEWPLVVNAINTTLNSVIANYSTTQAQLWNCIDQAISLKECSIYSFIPDPDSDPFAEEGIIWSLNYFFYNKKWKRVIFFTVRASSKASRGLKVSGDSLISFDSDMSDNDDDQFSMDFDE